ncbi:hypothetical protein Cni_G18999 [Canna indica]|uniref:Uncharacterized protein n=1 Tax=Canna indica TaxID=4628 RepID=A0AAQ3QJB6_9LILI|nr:hypothetical protein Cni_G18999 [Canna indica]
MELSLVVAEAAAMAEGSYWLRWQTLVCGLIVVLPAVASVAILARARAEPLRAVDFWAPCWAGMHPAWLLAYRGLVFLVMSWLLLKTILPVPDGLAEFYFYTQWTFTIVLVYFLIGTVVSARGCWLYSKRCITQDAENNRWQKGSIEQNNTLTLPFRFNKTNNTVRLQSYHELEADRKGAGFWEYAMQLIYQTSAGAAVLTDVVFWVVLVPFLYANNLRVTPVSILNMYRANANDKNLFFFPF